MKRTKRACSRLVTVTLAGLAALAIGRAAFAIPTGTMGLRTFDAEFEEIGLIELRVERVAGPYLIDPIDVTTDEFALVWVAVPAQTYAIYAIGNTGEPFAGPPLDVVFVPGGANDIIVNLIVPTPCPTDIDDDRATGVDDLLGLFAQWGPCLDCPADVNDDDVVNVDDMLALFGAWGACPD